MTPFRGQITETAHFANDLGLDSLDTVEVVMAIEEVRFMFFLGFLWLAYFANPVHSI